MLEDREQIRRNVEDVRRRIAGAATRSGRDPDTVTLVAVTKTVEIERIRSAVEAGVLAFGENYVQDLRRKQEELAGVSWHYIGTLQSSTAHRVADHADVVETVAGERAARRLAGRADRSGRTIDALIEVDLTEGRAGVRPDDLVAFADLVGSLPGLRLIGLMTVPADPARSGRLPRLVRAAPRAAGDAPGTAPRCAGNVDGDVVGLRGRGGRRRYDGPHRDRAVRTPSNRYETDERADERAKGREESA